MGWKSRGSGTARTIGVADEAYPPRLRDLKSPPDPVFLLGPWDHPGPWVAVVGARNATEDGIDVARSLARALAERGVAVVSGLARGIDAAAHQGALDAGGLSGAVLGTPLDGCYPRRHADLQAKLSRSLGLMSELAPGTKVSPATFATRNRLLAAIADVVVVVQGLMGSGSLITAKEARRLKRGVAAVPWDSRDPLGEAPHELIRAGATLVRDAKDVLELLHEGDASVARRVSLLPRPRVQLPPHEAALYHALRERPQSLDHLAEAARLTAAQLGAALLSLELAGLARRDPGGHARKARPTR